MFSQQLKLEIEAIVNRVVKNFRSFFLQLPTCSFSADSACLDFEMKEQYQRCVDLHGFEKIMQDFMLALSKEFEAHVIPLKFWSCSATDMDWVLKGP